ncbi:MULTISPECIES: hypothetical protein [Streptosporangium]|uniref:Uncharacterized protein n=1 Tax=Streptosporangium jomthongense TaxID=1193683 RepID=A0ABV8F281_9ACTN
MPGLLAAVNVIETERYDPGPPLAFAIADVFGLSGLLCHREWQFCRLVWR